MTEPKRVVIRKYENRRLYDTGASRYVNLDEVAGMVREGVDVRVEDAATGEDLTRVVLTQIIVEQAKAPGSALPLDMLRQMIMATGRAGQDSVTQYMRTLFDVYQNAYRSLAPQLNPLNPFSFMAPGGGMAPGAGQPMEPGAGAGAPPPPAGPRVSAPGTRPSANEDEMMELRRRLEELEGRMAGPRAKSARKRRRPVR